MKRRAQRPERQPTASAPPVTIRYAAVDDQRCLDRIAELLDNLLSED